MDKRPLLTCNISPVQDKRAYEKAEAPAEEAMGHAVSTAGRASRIPKEFATSLLERTEPTPTRPRAPKPVPRAPALVPFPGSLQAEEAAAAAAEEAVAVAAEEAAAAATAAAQAAWRCPACTYDNDPSAANCGVCEGPNPVNPAARPSPAGAAARFRAMSGEGQGARPGLARQPSKLSSDMTDEELCRNFLRPFGLEAQYSVIKGVAGGYLVLEDLANPAVVRSFFFRFPPRERRPAPLSRASTSPASYGPRPKVAHVREESSRARACCI